MSTLELIGEILARHDGREGALIPILHDIQDALGFVPETAVPAVAQRLNLTRAEVHGALSFYHDFRREPAGRHVVKLCQAEACQARGGRASTTELEARLGVAMGETSPDGRVSLEPVYCLGLCASGPAALVDGRPVGRLDRPALARLVSELSR
ncbi:MAG TPA: formate dehydrogenase subunit gamma [Phenylobacterium sp.]|uniref:formate dehydrogenase subunit gamma n=1 Tax=Phenylobacterium sp. TaxID=1871053 RepID=UPI002B4A8B96|nr:formate dehydrogenase subunit gamma [Phenylobacterium sp.]HKR88960.1 formate dehydrogenase subunit gamma [Phenylobacterium sp.]